MQNTNKKIDQQSALFFIVSLPIFSVSGKSDGFVDYSNLFMNFVQLNKQRKIYKNIVLPTLLLTPPYTVNAEI